MHALLTLSLLALSAPQSQAPQQREHFLAVYAVEDLLGQGGAFPRASELGDPRPPRKVQRAVDGPAPPRPPQDPAREAERELARQKERLQATEALADLVRSFVEPPLDAARDELRILAPGTLALVGSPTQHAWMESFLEVQRTHGGMVEIQADFLELPRKALDDLGIRHGDLMKSPQERQAVLDRLRAAAAEDLHGPTLVTFPRSVSAIEVSDQVAYVKEWDLRVVEPGAREVADPVVEVIDEGLRMEANAALLEHGLWGLKLRAVHAKVRRPVATTQVDLAGRTVEVALPEVDKIAVDSALRLEDGASAVLAVPHAHGERTLVVVVTIRQDRRKVPDLGDVKLKDGED